MLLMEMIFEKLPILHEFTDFLMQNVYLFLIYSLILDTEQQDIQQNVRS